MLLYLNLMVPHASLILYSSVPDSHSATTAMIQLFKVARIPAHTDMVVDAVMDCPLLLLHALLLFKPLEKLHDSALIHIHDVVTNRGQMAIFNYFFKTHLLNIKNFWKRVH